MNGLSIAAIVLGVFGLLLVIAGLRALWQVRIWRFTARTLLGLLLLSAGALAGAIAIGVQGYQGLVREELVAQVELTPKGEQRFEARFTFPDSKVQSFELSGDEFYVDAHILKWKSYANMIGLHTMWDLDRVAGRYRDVEQERTALRTVYSLGAKPAVDLFELRRRFAALAPLLDAEYGSATFAAAADPAKLDLFVSTSGLLLRPGAGTNAGTAAPAGSTSATQPPPPVAKPAPGRK
jgi:hypothetical protein